MASHKQGTVNIDSGRVGSLGSSDSATIQALFPASPIYEEKDQFASVEALKEYFQKNVLDGVVNDGGHTFGTFSMDFKGAPSLSKVKTGGGGLPASPYVPNPTSPGPGSMNPTDQPAPPDGFGLSPNDQYGTGVGSQADPKDTSTAISRQNIGELASGQATPE